MPAKYVVTKSRGKFSYELKASNGQTIVKMGPYNDKRAVNNAIKALQKNSAASVDGHRLRRRCVEDRKGSSVHQVDYVEDHKVG